MEFSLSCSRLSFLFLSLYLKAVISYKTFRANQSKSIQRLLKGKISEQYCRLRWEFCKSLKMYEHSNWTIWKSVKLSTKRSEQNLNLRSLLLDSLSERPEGNFLAWLRWSCWLLSKQRSSNVVVNPCRARALEYLATYRSCYMSTPKLGDGYGCA